MHTTCNASYVRSALFPEYYAACLREVSGQILDNIFKRNEIQEVIEDPLPLKMRQIAHPETSVRNYHFKLRNAQEEHRSHLHRGGNL